MTAVPPPRVRLRRALAAVALLVAVGFGAFAVASRPAEVGRAVTAIGVWRLLAALPLAALAVAATAQCWRTLLAGLGGWLPLGVAHRVFYTTQAGKYVPGAVWPFVAQDLAARQHGIPRRSVHAATASFLLLHLATALAVAAATLHGTSAAPWRWLMMLGAAAAVAPLVPPGAAPLRRRLDLPPRAGGRPLIAGTGWMLTAWLGYGGALAVLLDPFTGGSETVRIGVGGAALAWAVGLLVVVAPAGAGGREAALVLATAPLLPLGTAVSAALAWRLVTTVADLGLAAAASAVRRWAPPMAPPAADGRAGGMSGVT